MTSPQWETAHEIARQLVIKDTDANELGKANDYLLYYAKTGSQFFQYLETLAKQGKRIGHSKKTSIYYENIADVCSQYLERYQDDVGIMQQIMGWAFRLMRYYKEGFPIETIEELSTNYEDTPIISDRQAEIAEAIASQEYEIGQIVEAQITNKKDKGKNVTYTIDSIPTAQREPKIFDKLAIGQSVKVKIITLRDDGRIKKVKCLFDND